jgi:uncharacterized protein YecE (DUF72 family)
MRKARSDSKARTQTRARLAKISGRGSATPELRVGISGWRHAGWRGKFYPESLAQRHELEFASRRFNSIEINGSFYSLQLPSSYIRWYSETPPGFLFSVKGPRFITHMKKLRDAETPLANFFASGVLALREKLGPILWQLPPSLGWNRDRLNQFFELLPGNMRQAAQLARRHDDKLKARAWLKVDAAVAQRPLRYALEVRHPTFMVPEFFDLLQGYNVAFVFADTAKKWPYAEDITADFIYIRLHGAEQLYVSGYTDEALAWWADRIEHWRYGRQPADAKLVAPAKSDRKRRAVFVYFDNDAKVHAPFDAIRLAKLLGLRQKESVDAAAC